MTNDGIIVTDDYVHIPTDKVVEVLRSYLVAQGISLPKSGITLTGVRAERGVRGTSSYEYRTPYCADAGVTLGWDPTLETK